MFAARKTLLALLAISALIAVPAISAAPSPQASREQLERVRRKIEAVSRAIAADAAERDTATEALRRSEQALARSRDDWQRLQSQAVVAQGDLEQARESQRQARARLSAQRQQLAAQLRAAYELGTPGPLALLFGEDDSGRAARLAADYDALARARAQAIERIHQELDRLAQLTAAVAQRRDTLAAAQAQAHDALLELERRQQQRAQAVAKLSSRLSAENRRLKRLRAAENELEKLLASLGKALGGESFALGDQLPFAKLKGRLPWPLRGPLLARFGQTKAEGRLQWKGLWIGAPAGTPIQACARGRVAYVGWLSAYGLIVVLQHDHDYFTLYGHAQSIAATTGQVVNAGQVIGVAGDTGGYDRSGLYLEIRHGTDALNPGSWLTH
ncbi:MAG: peptidoglycan DD-metalloendopeptidase family protein [Gammaproteobacteria bacterium]|nr:peptidoglycan DD-metalloendopeptidase family protein [Gammaproteobacteria bacterium]